MCFLEEIQQWTVNLHISGNDQWSADAEVCKQWTMYLPPYALNMAEGRNQLISAVKHSPNILDPSLFIPPAVSFPPSLLTMCWEIKE